MNVKEVLDRLFDLYGGISNDKRRRCAFAMEAIATTIENNKVVPAFSYESKKTPEGDFFTAMGTPITIIINEASGKSITLPQHLFPMNTYSYEEIDALLCEVDDALDELL